MYARFLMSTLILLSLSVNSFAAAGIGQILNDYQYELSVEWDQRDEAFLKEATKKFLQKMKATGASKEDLLTTIEGQIQNPRALAELKAKIDLSGAKTLEEILPILQSEMNYIQSRGASWNGGVTFAAGVGILFAAVLVLFIVTAIEDSKYTCVEYAVRYECNYIPGWGDDCGYREVCVKSERKTN